MVPTFVLAAVLPLAAGLRLPAPRMCAPNPTPLCAALQSGADAPDLAAWLSAPKTARIFLDEYLSSEEWSCADAPEVPAALTDAMEYAPPHVLQALLMNVVQSAAKSTTTKAGTRSALLVNGLWDSVTPLRLSHDALKDTVDVMSGLTTEAVIEHAGGGDMELIRMQWAGLLKFGNYDAEALVRIRAALVECGKDFERERYE